jgi:hypothetical protein
MSMGCDSKVDDPEVYMTFDTSSCALHRIRWGRGEMERLGSVDRRSIGEESATMVSGSRSERSVTGRRVRGNRAWGKPRN